MSALKGILTIIVIFTILGLTFSCVGKVEQPGILAGTVKIGPIWPVERPGEKPSVPPEVFEARKIMVYDKNGNKLIETVNIIQIDHSQEGHYSVQLKPGTYTVDINRGGIDHSSEVPREVEIKAGQTVNLDIDIDTGIR